MRDGERGIKRKLLRKRERDMDNARQSDTGLNRLRMTKMLENETQRDVYG